MLTRSFFNYQYPSNVPFLHYLGNEFLKIKYYSKAFAVFFRITKCHDATNYQRSIAYIRIGEYFYNGDLTETPKSNKAVCPKDLDKARYYFQLGINICLRHHTLKNYAKKAIERIEIEQKVLAI